MSRDAKVVSRSRAEQGNAELDEATQQNVVDRRVVRSRYLQMRNLINDKKDDIARFDSEEFGSIISEVEDLYQKVRKPREQVADAEALLDLANTLVTSVKSHASEGLTPSDFISCLLGNFGQQDGRRGTAENSIRWKDIGFAVSPIFRNGRGCCTMLGPMNNEFKRRKLAVYKKRVKPTQSAPKELHDSGAIQNADTDKNMLTMFNILKKKKFVRLESLILNRKSFAQTVENLFALSFLVRDGRVEILVDEKGSHLVSPRNAPAANLAVSGEVIYNHFVFRFDFKDWKLMKDILGVGEEVMPHRDGLNMSCGSEFTQIRKVSRNRALVSALQFQ
ncbi:hypothetical protein F0562_035615 [Nyssa sinensis]|uniref:Non-structural maintenance of chromosomes element 4 n=1 Tax=Nyssa sinensis TaxID=561372 RepID=A0A5J5AD23_9ASTE|nr:hypothetical protein F0562_035615 [Nyssa sinensis]